VHCHGGIYLVLTAESLFPTTVSQFMYFQNLPNQASARFRRRESGTSQNDFRDSAETGKP
jgi:hypothetical protein